MTYAWDAILNHVARQISEAADVVVGPSDLTTPPNPELGDLAFGCFAVAKAQKKSPAIIATELVKRLNAIKKDHLIESANAAGPYVNVTLHGGEVISRVVKDVENDGDAYGTVDVGEQKTLMLEYAQPNTHKEVHVGHLRNLLLGASLAKILKRNNWNVITASYHGDVGAHVAKCLWLFVKKSASGFSPNLDLATAKKILAAVPKEDRTGKYLGQLYTEASKFLDENPDIKLEISIVQQRLEANDPAWNVLWQETRRWSIEEIKRIFEDLGVTIDRQYFESEVMDEGQRMVDDLIAKKVAHESQGAIIVDLEEKKLGVFLVRKSDGTSLYSTKDLALAWKKVKEYPALDRSLLLVDNRQSLYFKQLFEVLRMMGYSQSQEFVGHEFVTLQSGAMSSREGNIVRFEAFRDDVVGYAREETIHRHENWPEGRVSHTAWCLAMGGVKYGMLKQDSDKLYTFVLERALAFDGDTGPYIQYAATRLASILKKTDWNPKKGMKIGDPVILGEPTERRLAIHIAQFPSAVRRSGEELKPSVIAQWCFGMAHRVNDFYRDVPVMEATNDELRATRLRLVASALTTLTLGLDLLGIPLPEEM